jgi:alkylated DNA repair dioxygenase AlkB
VNAKFNRLEQLAYFSKMLEASVHNILPYDGESLYYGKIFSDEDSSKYYQQLLDSIKWENDQAMMFGKKIITKRKVAWYGEKPFQYTYSKVTKKAQLWTKTLLEILHKTEAYCQESYNSCLLNLYHDGSEGMAWHSDGEKDLKRNGSVASLTFGAERKFSFKHNESKERIDITLENGSLLEMKGVTQTYWLHRLPPTKKVHAPRINLTFRTIVNQ